jgi:hypothetical protein
LAKNISLSQVAMAVDSLMFGVTDNITELTKLATGFLPPQVANANAHGFVPTVYAAEALGLGLAGGNGTSNAFATTFGTLSVSDFASAVSNLTGINSGAVQNFVQNWINFYTAHPAATFGLSVTLASYGAAFGDAVGAALLNPSVNGTLTLLVSEEQNALIDNAEGLYQAGIALSAEPAHLALQGELIPIPDAGGGTLGSTINWELVGGEIPSPAADPAGTASGVTVLGGTEPGNTLQGSLGTVVEVVAGVELVFADVGSDNITSNSAGGGDTIYPDGGSDTVTLAANHTGSDTVVFGEFFFGGINGAFAITDGMDRAYLGFWGATATPTAIPNLFPGSTTGGTSADMTTITGFNAGAGGDVLKFGAPAWNGASSHPFTAPPTGDLIGLDGITVSSSSSAQLSPVWVNSSSNTLLDTGNNVLLYAPSGVSETNAQQLAAQLHTSSGAIVVGSEFPVPSGEDLHVLVAYDANTFVKEGPVIVVKFATNIADVDLVNTTASDQTSTANLNVYASDMVHLTGVSLTTLTSANFNFI